MAFTQHGSTDYSFGFADDDATAIATAIGIKPEKLSIQSDPEFTAEAKNEDGETASFVVGGTKRQFTLSGFITDLDLFNATGATFNYDGNHYIVVGRTQDDSNTEFRKGQVTGVSYPLIDGT